MKTLLQRTIKDKETNLYPVWLMRQAGRYMPVYMAMKAKSNGFLDMALTPWKAAEITMQPIEEFDMDAAIIFSDILIINHALGQELDYNPSPKLGPYNESFWDTSFEEFSQKCQPVYDAIKLVRSELDESKSLIGFAAAPYTLCKYMYNSPKLDIVNKLIPYIVEHLASQIEYVCDTIQIFDSWAGDIPANQFDDYVINPTKEIVDAIRNRYPDVGIIAFPRLVGTKINEYIEVVNADCTNISDDLPVDEIDGEVLQGGISISRLIKGEDITPVLDKMRDKAYVVNLAHGIDKTTPVENVRHFVDTVKEYRKGV
jgi:uroporphyrinogen decarboxylase